MEENIVISFREYKLTRSFTGKDPAMEMVAAPLLERPVGPTLGPEEPLHWGDLTDTLIRSGAGGRSIAFAQLSHDIMRALARVIERHTNVPLRPEMFREPQAQCTNQILLPEPHSIDLTSVRQKFERQLRYAGCSSEHFVLVMKNQIALNELVTTITKMVWPKLPSPYRVLDGWLPEQPLYTVSCVTEEEGLPLIARFIRAGKMQPEFETLYTRPEVEWTEWNHRNRRHTMVMVLSRVLMNDDSRDAVTPSEQSLVRMFMHRYGKLSDACEYGFSQAGTPAQYGIAPLLNVERLEHFVREHTLNWIRVLHKPLFDERSSGSIVTMRFNARGTLTSVDAVDAYENPRFNAHGAFALLVR